VLWPCWSAGQGADLDQVVGEGPAPAPDRGPLSGVQVGAIPAVASFEVADPSLRSGAPLEQLMEAAAVLDLLAGCGGSGLAGDRHGAHAALEQVTLDGWLAVAAVGGDRAGRAAGPAGDPLDSRCQLRAVGRVAGLDGHPQPWVHLLYPSTS
jgi:hypothetical protein